MTPETRPFSAAAWTMLYRIADGDADVLTRLVGYFRDPADEAGERWQFLRVADTNAWKSVELLLLRKMIERRFAEGELDAWTRTTPLGEEIRDGLHAFFEFNAVEFPEEPRSFGAFAYQELCAARLAGEIHAEVCKPADHSMAITEQMAARLAGRFPLLAQVIRYPELDIAGLTWAFMDWFLKYNFETQVALPTVHSPPPNDGLQDLAVLMLNCPTTLHELASDVYAQAEFTRRVRLAELRMRVREKSDGDLEREAREEVEAMLGRAVPIRARTLTDALAEAETIRSTENIMVAQNSLWAWYNALRPAEREEIGSYENKRRFWNAVRYRNRPL